MDTQTNEDIKLAVGLPQSIDRKVSISGTVKDLLDVGTNYSTNKKSPYNWNELVSVSRHTIQAPPKQVEEMDRVVENVTGAPFAKTSQIAFTDAPINTDEIKIRVSASSRPVVTIRTRKNRWLHEWTMSYYLSNLINRYDFIVNLSVLINREIDGDSGWQSLKILAERGTNVKLLTNQYVKENHFSHNKPDNLSIKVIQQIHLPFNLGILVDNKEVHVEESGENIYSNDPITVSKFQGEQ